MSVVGVILDTLLDDRTFADLLPAGSLDGVTLDTTFFDGRSHPGGGSLDTPPGRGSPDSAGVRSVSLRSPSGTLLGVARLSAVPQEIEDAQRRAEGRAYAACSLALLLAVLFPWRRISAGLPGLALTLGAIGGARALLLWQEVPQRLLPRTFGGPSLYGSSSLLGLLASPADLLLTAVAIYLASLAFRRAASLCGAAGGRLLSGLGGAASTLLAAVMTLSLPRDSRVALLERPAPLEWDARLVLWVALLLVLIGAAELWVETARSR